MVTISGEIKGKKRKIKISEEAILDTDVRAVKKRG
jgi:hypothetical protein